jgi:hypothetical protein
LYLLPLFRLGNFFLDFVCNQFLTKEVITLICAYMSGPLTVKCINPSKISFFRRFLKFVFIIFTLEDPFQAIVSTSCAILVNFGHMCSYSCFCLTILVKHHSDGVIQSAVSFGLQKSVMEH